MAYQGYIQSCKQIKLLFWKPNQKINATTCAVFPLSMPSGEIQGDERTVLIIRDKTKNLGANIISIIKLLIILLSMIDFII